MKSKKACSYLILATILFISACGRVTPSSPTPTGAAVLEPTRISSPAATSAPTELPVLEPTVDSNAVIPGGTVTIGIPREPDVIGPLMANETMERMIGWFILEGLVQIGPDGKPVPVLSEALPEVSPDALTLTYALKKGVKFSNGEPFTCADVQFTWKAVMSYLAPISKAGYELIKSVDCPDEATALVSLTQGYAQYLQLFSFILSKGSGSIDSINKWDHKTPIGTGPWMVWEWQVGDHVLLARNPNFREAGKPYLEYIVLKFLRADVALLVNGEVDIIWGLDENYLTTLDGLASEGISYSAVPSGNNEVLVFNLADPKYDAPVDAAANPHPILSDGRVRQAIQLGIDKDAIVKGLLPGGVMVSRSVLPSDSSICSLPSSEYSPEKAQAVLDETGWKVGADGIREKDGLRLSLKFTTETGSELRLKVQEAIVQYMKAIGVEFVAENLSPKEFGASWKAGGIRDHGRFDILLMASGTGITPGASLKRNFHSKRIPTAYNLGAGNNLSRYHNAEVDAWIDQALSSTDSHQQQELFCKVVEQVNRDLPVLPLYEHLVVNAHRARLQNFSVSTGPASFTFGSMNWWLKP